ncbi:hypothetical protein TIFTF001_029530 [Ficus carica]|uniref:Uncharacterized protein n=1 Tax=Ficus carica TaxID=3494 RepID=A0AA88IY60_FICCA|nr:hypothetical protein TIFTF001_029530 [Ficus carica]
MKTFRIDIAKQVSAGSSHPTIVADYISRAIRAKYWINQDKETSYKSRVLDQPGQGGEGSYFQSQEGREGYVEAIAA